MVSKKIIFGYGKPNYCEVFIDIQETENSYDINYEYKFGNESKINHPFYKYPNFYRHIEGNTIFKNELTEKLVKYLLMDFDELKQYSGNKSPENYKSIVMIQLTLLTLIMK